MATTPQFNQRGKTKLIHQKLNSLRHRRRAIAIAIFIRASAITQLQAAWPGDFDQAVVPLTMPTPEGTDPPPV